MKLDFKPLVMVAFLALLSVISIVVFIHQHVPIKVEGVFSIPRIRDIQYVRPNGSNQLSLCYSKRNQKQILTLTWGKGVKNMFASHQKDATPWIPKLLERTKRKYHSLWWDVHVTGIERIILQPDGTDLFIEYLGSAANIDDFLDFMDHSDFYGPSELKQ